MTNDPQSQPTPPRAPSPPPPGADWAETQTTHYSPRQAPSPDPGDHSTHYSPRPDPAAAATSDPDATHYAQNTQQAHPGAPAQPTAPAPGYSSGYQSIPLAPNPAWSPGASSLPPGGLTSPHTGVTDAPTGAGGSWAPSNWHLPEDRFEAPEVVVEKKRRQISLTRVLSWVLAVVILAVGAGFVYVRFIRVPPQDLNTKVPQTAASSANQEILRGDEVVRRYLTALSVGDIDKALSYGPLGGAGANTLITKQAYAGSQKVAPISAISVPQTDANATKIPVTYRVGAQAVSTTFDVIKQDNGSWKLAKTTATFQFRGTQVDSIPLRINGTPVSWNTPVELVPGNYQLSTGLPFLAFDQSTTLRIQNLNYTGITTHTVAPSLTEEGRAALLAAVKKSIEQCAARKELQPANCPNALSTAGSVMIPSSIVWKLIGDPLRDARPALSAADQSQATMNLSVTMTISGTLEGGGTVNAQERTFPGTVTADMKVTTAEQVAPKWK